MKIKLIHIYGFGQFENKVIQFPPEKTLDIVYGHNEAGKSTIMAFIHAIFFGFPTRNQTENRYEPKTGGKYGGKITLETAEGKIITIERIGGRTTSELTIVNEDGSINGEEDLQALFKGLNRTLYQSIFSFGMKGLQAIENVTAADLSNYLFTAGTIGGQSLFELEKKLTKKLDELYKPSGKKPILNEKLSDLEALRNEIKKWDGKIEIYNKCIEEQERIRNSSKEFEGRINQLQFLAREYEKKHMLEPHLEERRKWQIQLSQVSKCTPFPENGLERLQQLQHELRPLKGQESSINNKISNLKQELSEIHFEEAYISQEANIRSLKEKQKVYELQSVEKEKYRVSFNYEQTEIHTLLEKLGFPYDENRIIEIDTSLAAKQQLKELVTKLDLLKNNQKYLDEQFNKAKADLEYTEKSVQKIKQEKKSKRSQLYAVLLYFAVIAGGIIIGKMSNSLYPIIISIILLIGLMLNKFTLKNGKNLQLEKEQTILKQKESLFEDVLKQYESWEKEYLNAEQELSVFCSQQKLPKGLPVTLLLDAFEWIEELKKRIRTKNHYIEELNRIETALTTFEDEVDEIVSVFSMDNSSSSQVLNQMINIIEREKEKKYRAGQLNEKLNECNDERTVIKQQISYLESEITKLFTGAKVVDENEFRQKGAAYEEYKVLKAKLQSIDSYLHSVLKAGEEYYLQEIEEEDIQYEHRLEEIHEQAANYEKEMKQLQVKGSEIAVEIKNLEEGTTYSECVHRYETLKTEFQETAGQWAVYKVAKDLIDRTKGYYREVRLPQVIETAQTYFSFLTFEKYPHIFAPTEESGFMVEREDGVRFQPNELSQATTEQLYLSLRLALANSFRALTAWPILIDDSFVNFDINRTKRALQLIRQISTEQQIIFFTCHQHIVELFDEDEVIHL